MQRGVANAETGIRIDTFETAGNNPREYAYNEEGQSIGFAHNIDPNLTFTVSGEISGSTGLAAIVFGAAITLANVNSARLGATNMDGVTEASFWGIDDAGDVLLESVSISEGRTAWKILNFTATRHPLISVA